MRKRIFKYQSIVPSDNEKCAEGMDAFSFKFNKQQYGGFWCKPLGLRKKMEIQSKEGRTVRCIDCIKRKKCPHLRSNKYTRKPCKDYVVDLAKQSRLMNQKMLENQKKKNQSSS